MKSLYKKKSKKNYVHEYIVSRSEGEGSFLHPTEYQLLSIALSSLPQIDSVWSSSIWNNNTLALHSSVLPKRPEVENFFATLFWYE
jgi:hypothetical protein